MSRIHVFLRGQELVLDDSLLLGAGGEARVYRHPAALADGRELALKVFHELDPQLSTLEKLLASRVRALRAEKLPRFCALRTRLPAGLVAPREILVDGNGQLVGYAMPRVMDAKDIAILSHKRERALVSANDVVQIFRALIDTVAAVHRAGVVVGDMNDGNVLLAGAARTPLLIDVDSMQLGSLPCPVAHERFVDPRLYGKSFTEHACFDEGSDAFALRVLLFQSLTCLHPYGGVHDKFPTLLRRAEARHSVFRSDVRLPRSAISFHTLPEELLADLEACFDGDVRRPLEPRLLEVRFRACNCGAEHARARCPVCKTAVQAPAIRTSGGVSEETVLQTRGTIVLARVAGGALRYLVDEDGRVRREDHATVVAGPRVPGMRFEIAGDATWLGLGHDLVLVRDGQVLDRASTTMLGGEPVFAAGRGGLWLLEGDSLLHHPTRVRAGRVLEGQTRLFSSDEGGLGVGRAGRMLLGFLFRKGAFFDAAIPSPRGKLVDLDATFDVHGGGVLVGMAFDEEANGAVRRKHALTLLDARGARVASIEGSPDGDPILENIRGKALVDGRLLAATREGVCLIDVDAKSGRLSAGSVFADTRPFVDATVELLPAPGGQLFVVSTTAITRLRLKGR